MIPLTWAYWSMLALYAYRNPTAFVSAAIDFSSPVRKCQPFSAPGRLYRSR